jgi:hypothetical protein
MKILLLSTLAVSLHAVTISDTIRLPDDSLANGRISISLVTGTFSSSTTFAAFRRDYRIVAGVPTPAIDLAANSTLTPANSLYRVEYYLTNGTTQTEYWSIPTGGPYTIREVRHLLTTQDYSANQTGSTWTVSAATHGFRTKNLIVTCFDNATPASTVDCAVTVHPTTFAVAARFGISQTGRIHINGSACAGYCPNPSKAFTAATSVTFLNSEHNLNTARITARCYDDSTPAAEFECQYTVHPTTYTVTFGFASAATGYVVLTGR